MQHHQQTHCYKYSTNFQCRLSQMVPHPGAHVNYYKHWQAISLLPRHMTIWNILGEPWKTECGCPRGIENGHIGSLTVSWETGALAPQREKPRGWLKACQQWHKRVPAAQWWKSVPAAGIMLGVPDTGVMDRDSCMGMFLLAASDAPLVSPCHQKSHIQCSSSLLVIRNHTYNVPCLSLPSEITHTMFLVSPCHQKSHNVPRLSLSSEIIDTMFLISPCHQKSHIQCCSWWPVILCSCLPDTRYTQANACMHTPKTPYSLICKYESMHTEKMNCATLVTVKKIKYSCNAEHITLHAFLFFSFPLSPLYI